MSSKFSRRSLAQGAMWAVPTIAATSAIPAYAASICSPTSKQKIDEAFNKARALNQCNGQPAQLELNIYQALAASDGFVSNVAVNVKNLSSCTLNFTAANPLHLTVAIRNNVSLNDSGRSLSNPSTSQGSISYQNYPIQNQPVGTAQRIVNWTFVGSISPNQEKDLALGFLDGNSPAGRWKNYITITPELASGAPTYESIGLSSNECRDYYNQQLALWKLTVNWVTRGPKNGTQALPSGSAADSRVIGNFSSVTGSASTNGIW